MSPRLGINIDHVATLRQARGEFYPNLAQAAEVCIKAGADQITIHLREDRRHIQDLDVKIIRDICSAQSCLLNLEMACDDDIIEIAKDCTPDYICLVPEKRLEMTTEGGLNLLDSNVFDSISMCIEKLKSHRPEVLISLFLEADREILKKAVTLNIDAVELHTGDYASAVLNDRPYEYFLKDFATSYQFLKEHSIHSHAGHGLTDKSLLLLLQQQKFQEYNIGHWIISQAVFDGLDLVVSNLRNLIDEF